MKQRQHPNTRVGNLASGMLCIIWIENCFGNLTPNTCCSWPDSAGNWGDPKSKRAVVESISPRHVVRTLADADLKPHRSRYWLNANPEDPEAFAKEVENVCDLYLQSQKLHQQGISVVSTDEKTGIQALELKHPTKPMKPGLVERQEFEYERHRTQCLTVNFHIATGINHYTYDWFYSERKWFSQPCWTHCLWQSWWRVDIHCWSTQHPPVRKPGQVCYFPLQPRNRRRYSGRQRRVRNSEIYANSQSFLRRPNPPDPFCLYP